MKDPNSARYDEDRAKVEKYIRAKAILISIFLFINFIANLLKIYLNFWPLMCFRQMID